MAELSTSQKLTSVVNENIFILQETEGKLKWVQGRECAICNVSVDVEEQSFTLQAQSYVAAIRLTAAGNDNIWFVS